MTKFGQNISKCKFVGQKPEVVEQLKIHSNPDWTRNINKHFKFVSIGRWDSNNVDQNKRCRRKTSANLFI
jgi:hypothetical protein